MWRKERVLLVRRISRIFVMEEEASSTSGRPTLWSHRNRELERDKGELGWKLYVIYKRRVSNIRRLETYAFPKLASPCRHNVDSRPRVKPIIAWHRVGYRLEG